MAHEEAVVAAKVTEKISEVAATRLGPDAADITPDTPLIDLGIIDSVAVFELVAFVEEEFGLSVPHDALVPENFETPAALTEMVCSLERTPRVRQRAR